MNFSIDEISEDILTSVEIHFESQINFHDNKNFDHFDIPIILDLSYTTEFNIEQK